MNRKEILSAAEECVCGKRNYDYGTPENNFETIGYLLVTFSIINIIESVIFKHNLSKIEKYLNEKNN